jgi:hypothetical protein
MESKIMFRKIYSLLVIIFVLTIMLNLVVIRGDNIRRNDENIPTDNYVLGYSELYKQLDTLRKLNDTIVSTYVREIERALAIGDLQRANALLRELDEYLRSKPEYMDIAKNDTDIAKAISFLDSVVNVSGEGVEVNMTNYLLTLGKILNDEKLIEEALRIHRGEVVYDEFINELLGALREAGGVAKSNKTVEFNPGEILNKTPSVKPQLNIFKPPRIMLRNSSTLLTTPIVANLLTYIILSIVIGIIALTIYYSRNEIKSFIQPLMSRVTEKLLIAQTRIHRAKTHNERLVQLVKLYLKWYIRVHRLGYKREKWETIREFASKIKHSLLRKIGLEIARIYEETVYGGETIKASSIERVESMLERIREEKIIEAE